MGNRITVDYQINTVNVITIKKAGSKNILISKNFERSVTNHYFGFSPGQSKTFIVTVNNQISRAVGSNKTVQINEMNGQLTMTVIPSGFQMASSLDQIIEKEKQNLNWNLIKDEEVKNQYMESANNVVKVANEIFDYLGIGLRNAKIIPANVDIIGISSKITSDIIMSFIKTASIKCQSDKDRHFMESFQRIHHQLVALSRTINIDFEYLTKERKIDNGTALEFLHSQLMKITNTDMLPFLEQCNNEETIVVYIFAIGIATKIFEEMRKLNNNIPNQLERRYMEIFSQNLHEIWTNVLDSVVKETKIRIKGFIIKSAELTFRNNHVYKINSIWRSKAQSRIDDIKEAFIMNIKYQMKFLHGNPEEIIKRCQGYSNNIDKADD